MSIKLRLVCLLGAGLFATSPAQAIDLVGTYDLALKSDPLLRAADFRRQATGQNTRIARANMLPQIAASGSWTWGDSTTSIGEFDLPDSDIDTQNYSAGLVQSLYRQANYEAMDVARSQVSQADAIYQIAYQDFLLRISESYFTVLTFIDGVTFAEAEERAFQRQYEQAQQRFEVGLTAVTDVYEAKASFDNARARAIVARNNLADAKEALREITGQYFEEYDALQAVLPLVEPDPLNADDWVQLALQNNPAVLSARSAFETANANMRLARSGYFPTLDLRASISRFENDKYRFNNPITGETLESTLQADDTQIGLQLDVPIYQGGRVNAQTKQAKLFMDAAGEDLDAVQRAATRDARNAYRAVLAGIEEVQAFEQASLSAEKALEATQAGFEVGIRTIVDVLIAEQRKFQAKRDNSVARHAYIIRHLRLKSVAGMLNSEDLAIVNQLLE